MKLIAIILLAACLTASARGLTQQVTINAKNAEITDVFKTIRQQTGYLFVFDMDMIKEAKKVTVHIINGTIDEVLKACFDNQPFSYTILDKTIVVTKKETKSPNADATNVDVNALIDVSGKVTDADGNPLSGASVKVKGTTNGTTTHTDGTFILRKVDQDAVLEMSFVGYEPYTIAVNNRSSITASLKLNIIKNPEVIINKGYYTEKQKTSVSNVGVVKAADIEKQPVQNVLLALQARIPGLFVTQGSGNAGGGLVVRVQGQNSIRNGNDPLYVVDGVPIDAKLPSTGVDGPLNGSYGAGRVGGYGDPLNYINPLDIESVEVLKDADATAIYGSRAANGAILITTKKGKAGAMKLDLNMETGWGKMTHRVDMMNTRQYLDMRYEAFANDGIDWRQPSVSANDLKVWDTTRYTNWQDLLFGGTARYNNINASVSGGSPNVRYLVSGTYHKETTIWPLSGDFADQKVGVHFNLNANNNNQKIRMQFTGDYMFDGNKLPLNDLTSAALLLEPDAPPLLNADGSINWAPDASGNTTLGDANVMTQRYHKYTNKTHNLVGSLKLDYSILPGLNVSSSFGYNYMQTNDFIPYPLIAAAPELRASGQRRADFGDRNIQSWIIEPQAGYHTRINKGILDFLVGSTFQNQNAESQAFHGTGQLSDAVLGNINAAANISGNGNSSMYNYKYNALFGRASYNWYDKYIFSMNARRDGSSRFGPDRRFHNFGSVGAAWLFSNESFFKSRFDFISFGKLRGSYGTTGSDQIGDYRFMSLYEFYPVSAPYQGIVGLVPIGIPNPELEWEETRKLQIGIDLGFLQDRLVVNANFVRNRSSNQLLGYALPLSAGFTSYTVNLPATIQNRNWEVMITGKIIQHKDFSWTNSVNVTIPQNKLIEYPGLENSTFSNLYHIGEPIDAVALYRWTGVASGTGDYLYADNKGNPTLTPQSGRDQNVWISKFPKFYGGFQNSISYKGIQLDFIFQFVKQTTYNDIAFWNGNRYPGQFAAGVSNQSTTVLDRWKKPRDNASVARYSIYEQQYVQQSDHRYADASYISLKNISLFWAVPQKWLNKTHFRNFSVYMHAQNLLTLSNYKGLNPETGSMNTLPPLQVWTAGLQFGL